MLAHKHTRFVLACIGFMASCDQAEVPGAATTRVACETFAQASSTPVTFEPFLGGPGPTLKVQATPYNVALAPTVAPGQYSGHAQWQIDVPGLYGIYVDEPATFVLRDAAKTAVGFERQLGSPTTCDRIRRYAFVNLAPGAYSIEVGPVPVPSVRLQLVTTVANDGI